jgi:PAS domain S-box-containing protein
MYDSQGNLTHLIPAGIDISERTKREQEILQLTMLTEMQRHRLDNLITNIPGMVYEAATTPETNASQVKFVSKYAEKLLGYPVETWESTSSFWQKVIVPEDYEHVLQAAIELYEGGEPGVIQYRCLTQDGQIIYVEAHVKIVYEPGKPIETYGIVMDITERKQFEQALAEYAEDLRRSNEELEQFAYVASHDLQEPLRMVTSYLQLIEQRYRDQLDETATEFIDFAIDGAARMKALINDLLTYSRVQRSKEAFQPVQLDAVLDQVLHSLQLTIDEAKANITRDPLPEIVASEPQMAQLFQNLVGNALKFQGNRPPEIHIGVEKRKNDWVFCVSDNGIGIEEVYLDRIFVIFQRLHARDEYPGTGIGLAICKKIVDKHGGSIWVESTPGEGTTFYFTIPSTRRRKRTYGGS